jgi:hypothetical protein
MLDDRSSILTGAGISLSVTLFRPPLDPTQLSIQMVLRAASPGVKLATHLHLVPWLRMYGAVELSPLLRIRSLLGLRYIEKS